MNPDPPKQFPMANELRLHEPIPRKSIDEQIERVRQENVAKGKAAGNSKATLSDAERKARKAAYMRDYWKRNGNKYKHKRDRSSGAKPIRKAATVARKPKKAPKVKKLARAANQRVAKQPVIAANVRAFAGLPPEMGNGHAKLPPYPFKYCPKCGKQMPTMDRAGLQVPASKAFCPDCGYEIPKMKG